MDCRPIAKGNSLRKVITSALMRPFKQSIIAATAPTQFGGGLRSGGTILIFALMLLLESNPEFVLIGLDIENAFNEVTRKEILDFIFSRQSLQPLWYYLWRCWTPRTYVGLDSGPAMVTAQFRSKEGVQ